jgi:O-antigen ligase
LEIWTAGARACQLHCGWGAGLGNFPAAYDQTSSFVGLSKNVGVSRPAHDIFLSVVVETGIIGLTLLVLALLAELRDAARLGRTRAMPSLTSAIVGILVANVFLSAIWFKYFWLVFALSRAASSAAMVHPERSQAFHFETAEKSPLT